MIGRERAPMMRYCIAFSGWAAIVPPGRAWRNRKAAVTAIAMEVTSAATVSAFRRRDRDRTLLSGTGSTAATRSLTKEEKTAVLTVRPILGARCGFQQM